MIQIHHQHDCCGCQACVQICPKQCISTNTDAEGFWYPTVQEGLCIKCGLCEKVCPMIHHSVQSVKTPTAYAAWNLDASTRKNSSSGGIFTLLSEQILSKGGVIYGVAMIGSSVRHIRVDRQDQLPLLQGSKYVQSDVSGTYSQAKKDLLMERPVLYSGTPCQIEGLLNYLGRPYENLFCVDMICHGVPSPLVWDKYVSFREKAAASTVDSISFRDKASGWSNYGVRFSFHNGSEYRVNHGSDPYIRAFLRNLTLRPSCYQCKFRKLNRRSDITLADFWGVDQICPEMNDNSGTSLVIVHSEKGRQIIAEAESAMKYLSVDVQSAIQYNPSMIKSLPVPKKRHSFMSDIMNAPFDAVVSRYARKNRFNIKRILKKVFRL